MKRPLAKAGLCLLFSLLVFSFCSVFIILAGGVLAGSLILLRGHLKSTLQRKYLLLACISVLVGGALSASALAVEYSLTEAYCGKSVTAKMTAISKRKTVDGYAVCVSVEEIDGRSIRKFKAEIYPEDTVEEGDCFLAKTTFGEKNKMKRINGEPVLTARETVIESFFLREQNIYAVLKKCRDALSGSIFAFLSGEEGGLVCSVMTGDKDFLKYETKDNFARSGISHILAVSGLHITVIIGALWKLIKRFRPRWLAFLLLLAVCCALTLFYSGALTVMRSAVMCLFAFGAQLAMRKSDAATSLAAAVIFLSLLSPRCVLDVSFWLSFSSCFALTVAYPWYEKRRESESLKKQNFILQQAQKILMPAVFISALSLPVLLFAGMPLSVIAPLTNLFVIPLVPWLIIPGFMTAICYALPFLFEIAKLTALISGLAAKIILLISELFASFSLSAVCANAPYLKIWIIFAILLVTLYLLFARDKLPRGLVAYCVCFMLLFGIGSRVAVTLDTPSITRYYYDSCIFEDKGTSAVLLGDFSRKKYERVLSFLRYRFIDKPDYVIIIKTPSSEQQAYLRGIFGNSEIVILENSSRCISVGNFTLCGIGKKAHIKFGEKEIELKAIDEIFYGNGAATSFLFHDDGTYKAVIG